MRGRNQSMRGSRTKKRYIMVGRLARGVAKHAPPPAVAYLRGGTKAVGGTRYVAAILQYQSSTIIRRASDPNFTNVGGQKRRKSVRLQCCVPREHMARTRPLSLSSRSLPLHLSRGAPRLGTALNLGSQIDKNNFLGVMLVSRWSSRPRESARERNMLRKHVLAAPP